MPIGFALSPFCMAVKSGNRFALALLTFWGWIR